MAARVHFLQAASSSQPSATATALLQASAKLWAASDMDGVAATAMSLLHELLPEATVRRCEGGGNAHAGRATECLFRIGLTRHDALAVNLPDTSKHKALLDAAAELIEARIAALDQRDALAASIEQLGRSERLQRALYAIANQASAASTDLAPMFQALHEIVGTLMYAENFYIALYDAQHDNIRFPYYADTVDKNPPDPLNTFSMGELAHGPTWYVVHDGQPLMGSLEAIGEQVDGPLRLVGAICKDWLGVPLLHDDEVVGCVVVQSYDHANHYDEQDKALLIYVAQHIQTALERRMAHARLEQRVEERTVALSESNEVLQREVLERQRGERLQAALFRIAELASTSGSIDDFYATVHRVVGDLINARNFYIALLSDDGTRLSFPYSVDERDADRPPRQLGKSFTEYVLRHGNALLADGSTIEKLRATGEVTMSGTLAECWLGVPLVCAEHTVGVLVVQSYSAAQRYTPRDQELLTFVSYHIANALERVRAGDSLRQAYAQLENRVNERTRALALANRDLRKQIIERERVEARLKYETLHDALTGLPNRTLLMQRLADALARYRSGPGHGFAVLFMDLDRFKVINDSVGHMVGDDLLMQVGSRIRGCLKAEDVVARLGGDEFAVLLEGVDDVARACQIAERIIGALNAPFRLSAKEMFTSTSIGIALAAPHYRDPSELLRDADSAMYCAKADGRHRYAVFDDHLRKEAVSLLEVESDLRRGLTRNEFVPYYQPIIDLSNGEVAGYEALMRWRHPQRGILLPGEFLNVAEDTGTSETIDWQIFEQVCRDANALAGNRGAFVAINLSARHFSNPQLSQRLLGLLAEYTVQASCFHVEVTERALLENTPAVKRALQAFRKAGISISLDDFGTGYSSLSYLHQYPLQTLKIDRSFVANLSNHAEGSGDAVIRAILAMTDTLSIQVIAEGVETAQQRDTLRKLGCRYVQGFLYAKGQPIDAWLGATAAAPPA